MTVEIRYSVMTPEAGARKTTGGPPPMMQAQPGIYMPPPGLGGPRPGTGALQRSIAGPSSFAPAKRLDALEGKTVYLVDTGFGGSYKFMQQLQKWFAENMPSVTTIRKRKTGHVFMDDTTDLWEEIKAKGHAAVLGVAG
jgi:hypothetical protein